MYCYKHNEHYDLDSQEDCPVCEEEDSKEPDQNDQYEADKEERETEYAESHYHPAEGN